MSLKAPSPPLSLVSPEGLTGLCSLRPLLRRRGFPGSDIPVGGIRDPSFTSSFRAAGFLSRDRSGSTPQASAWVLHRRGGGGVAPESEAPLAKAAARGPRSVSADERG